MQYLQAAPDVVCTSCPRSILQVAPLYLFANTSMYTLGLRRLLVLHSPCCFYSSIRLAWCLQARVICRQISNLWMFIRPSCKNVGCGNPIIAPIKLFITKIENNMCESICQVFLLSNTDTLYQFSFFGRTTREKIFICICIYKHI